MARAKSKKPESSQANDALWREVIAETRLLADTLRDGGEAAVEKTFRVTRLPVPTSGESLPVRENLNRLRAAAAAFAKQREQAEAKCAEVNPVIRQIGAARLADHGRQSVGAVVECWFHEEHESTTYNVAAIQVPEGVGVLRYTLAYREQLNEDTPRSFVPFGECEPSVQAGLAPHIDRLVADLVSGLKLPTKVAG